MLLWYWLSFENMPLSTIFGCVRGSVGTCKVVSRKWDGHMQSIYSSEVRFKAQIWLVGLGFIKAVLGLI